MHAPFRSEVGVSEVHDLMKVAHLFTALKHPQLGSEPELLRLQIRTAYNELNPLVQQALQTKILSPVSEDGTYGKNEDGTVDIIDAAQHLYMPNLILEMTKSLPVIN